jgi:hypothetical protein
MHPELQRNLFDGGWQCGAGHLDGDAHQHRDGQQAMTRPKSGPVAFTGINRDQIPGMVEPDQWTDGRNIMFVAGQTVRTPGEGLFAETGRLFPADVVHFVDTGSQQWWIYASGHAPAGVGVTDGITHYNITPTGWGPIASSNLVLTIGDLNTLPFLNHPEIGPFYWDGIPANKMVKLPGCQTALPRDAGAKNFLMAVAVDDGTTPRGQVGSLGAAGDGAADCAKSDQRCRRFQFCKSSGPPIDGIDVRDQFWLPKLAMGVLQYTGGQFVFRAGRVPFSRLFARAPVEVGNLILHADRLARADQARHDQLSECALVDCRTIYGGDQFQHPSSCFMHADHDNDARGLSCGQRKAVRRGNHD